jgi:hypothetical protein
MPEYTQTGRPIAITTFLGDDALLLRSFAAYEGIFRPFRFDLDLLSEDNAIAFGDIVGQGERRRRDERDRRRAEGRGDRRGEDGYGGGLSSENVGVNKSVNAAKESAGVNFAMKAGKDFSTQAGKKLAPETISRFWEGRRV